MDDRKLGLYNKFEVKRADGSSEPGGKHERCQYFVLDLNHDEFALQALAAYANACRIIYPRLAEDLAALVERIYQGRLDLVRIKVESLKKKEIV